jgi:hypothetical protein
MSSAEGSSYANFAADAPVAEQDSGEQHSSPVETSQDYGQQQEQDAYNPAWENVFGKLPLEFHKAIKPELETWDRNYQQLREQYKPWEELGQPYDQVQRNLGVIQQLNDNPQAFYQKLGELLGVTPGQAQQIAQDQQQEGFEGPDDEDAYTDPEVKRLQLTVQAMQEQQEAWKAEREAQEQEQEVAYYEQEAEGQLQQIEAYHQQNYPGVPFNARQVIQNVLVQTYQNPDAEPDLSQAYKDYMSLVTSIRSAPRPGAGAPSVVNPSGGGIPPTQVIDPRTAGPEERKALVAQYLAQLNSQ